MPLVNHGYGFSLAGFHFVPFLLKLGLVSTSWPFFRNGECVSCELLEMDVCDVSGAFFTLDIFVCLNWGF